MGILVGTSRHQQSESRSRHACRTFSHSLQVPLRLLSRSDLLSGAAGDCLFSTSEETTQEFWGGKKLIKRNEANVLLRNYCVSYTELHISLRENKYWDKTSQEQGTTLPSRCVLRCSTGEEIRKLKRGWGGSLLYPVLKLHPPGFLSLSQDREEAQRHWKIWPSRETHILFLCAEWWLLSVSRGRSFCSGNLCCVQQPT